MPNYYDKAIDAFDDKEYNKAIDLFNKAIDNKEYEATSKIALIYLTGLGIDKDIDKGLDYLFLGDKHDDALSISALGDYYYTGKYLNKDIDKAKAYYERASKLLEPHSIGMLGLFLYNEEKYSEAIEYFKSASLYIDTNSMYYLAKCAYDGLGMDKDLNLSFELYKRLYEYSDKNIEVNKNLADMYFNGYGTDINIDSAKELYLTLEDDDSKFNLAMIYMKKNKYDLAIPLFKQIKSPKAQFELGRIEYLGLGVEENKNDAFFKFYASSMSGYIYAYPFLADCYYYGCGVKKDYDLAIKWYNEAIKNNIPKQYINLAMVYFKLKKYDEAIDVLNKEEECMQKYKALGSLYLKKKNYELAYNNFLEARKLGDINSIYELYKLTKKGKGCNKNKEEANKLYLEYIASKINE